jgi:hypothetical protein
VGTNSIVVPPSTRCKHGEYRCDRCGTSDRVDTIHRTAEGVGEVGKLLRESPVPPDAWQREVRKKERPGQRLRMRGGRVRR